MTNTTVVQSHADLQVPTADQASKKLFESTAAAAPATKELSAADLSTELRTAAPLDGRAILSISKATANSVLQTGEPFSKNP